MCTHLPCLTAPTASIIATSHNCLHFCVRASSVDGPSPRRSGCEKHRKQPSRAIGLQSRPVFPRAPRTPSVFHIPANLSNCGEQILQRSLLVVGQRGMRLAASAGLRGGRGCESSSVSGATIVASSPSLPCMLVLTQCDCNAAASKSGREGIESDAVGACRGHCHASSTGECLRDRRHRCLRGCLLRRHLRFCQ